MSTCSVLWILIYGEWGFTTHGIWTGHIIFGDSGHHLILMGNMPLGSMVYHHSKHCVPKFKTLHNPFSPATLSIYMPCSECKHYIKVVLIMTVWELSIDKNRLTATAYTRKNKCHSTTTNYLCILRSNTGLENLSLNTTSVYLMMFH